MAAMFQSPKIQQYFSDINVHTYESPGELNIQILLQWVWESLFLACFLVRSM